MTTGGTGIHSCSCRSPVFMACLVLFDVHEQLFEGLSSKHSKSDFFSDFLAADIG